MFSHEKLEELAYKTGKNIDKISIDVGDLKESLILEAEARKSISKEVDKKIATLKGALWLASAVGAGFFAVFIVYIYGNF